MNIEGTNKTPQVSFDSKEKRFLISGKSLPEDARSFYGPILKELQAYLDKEEINMLIFDFKFEYFNSSSAKSILDIFYKLKNFRNDPASDLVINWYSEHGDDDMVDAGGYFEMSTGLKFNYIMIEEENS